ncbi:MAG TPA: DEAD/DEAH box helicase, partial [Candidatus Methylacidiphilales bacterium]|nr:DEAD/DEAH box helicase [Candidatus Methylacidiphilales bacterium]
FLDPSPIQEQAIPLVLSGKDLIASAQTGTGKTAAFGLPIISKLDKRGTFRALIVEPTRELAVQVEDNIAEYAKFTSVETACIYGGVKYNRQISLLKRGIDIVVATPGRLLDHMEQGNLNLDKIEYLVLDEADRMLDMGFMPDVRRIIEACPKARQTLLFSATMPPEIERLSKWALVEPETINIGERRSPAETVKHVLYPVANTQKFELLLALLEHIKYDSVLIFVRTKDACDGITARLKSADHLVATIHSDRSQSERQEALDGFRRGRYEVLVATDIASRGIDVAGVSHVINYDVPQNVEDYVHRIGRTGRAQTSGDALTIMTAEEAGDVANIERYIGALIPRLKLDGFNYVYSAVLDTAPAAHGGLRNVRGGRTGKGYSFGMKKRR